MTKRNGQLAALLLAIVMILTFSVTPIFAAGDQTFKDVPKSEWYYDYVMCLANRGIVKGYGDTGEFRPLNLIIREHAAKMVALAAELNYKGKKAKFPDVDPEGEMSPYIAALVDKGAVEGFPDGTFRPYDNIKRSHAAKIIQIAFGLKESSMKVDIVDFPTHDAGLTGAIKILASNGVVKGYGSTNRFNPDDEINRAELAKMLCIAIAVKAVQEAEAQPTDSNINHAQTQVDRLSDTQDTNTKAFLQARLDALDEEGESPPVGPTYSLVDGVTLTGETKIGNSLTASPVPAEANVKYQWKRGDSKDGSYSDIPGETGSTYCLTDEDKGKWIQISVTGQGNYTGSQTAVVGPVVFNKLEFSISSELEENEKTEVTVDVDSAYVLTAAIPKNAKVSASNATLKLEMTDVSGLGIVGKRSHELKLKTGISTDVELDDQIPGLLALTDLTIRGFFGKQTEVEYTLNRDNTEGDDNIWVFTPDELANARAAWQYLINPETVTVTTYPEDDSQIFIPKDSYLAIGAHKLVFVDDLDLTNVTGDLGATETAIRVAVELKKNGQPAGSPQVEFHLAKDARLRIGQSKATTLQAIRVTLKGLNEGSMDDGWKLDDILPRMQASSGIDCMIKDALSILNTLARGMQAQTLEVSVLVGEEIPSGD